MANYCTTFLFNEPQNKSVDNKDFNCIKNIIYNRFGRKIIHGDDMNRVYIDYDICKCNLQDEEVKRLVSNLVKKESNYEFGAFVNKSLFYFKKIKEYK